MTKVQCPNCYEETSLSKPLPGEKVDWTCSKCEANNITTNGEYIGEEQIGVDPVVQ